MKIRTSNLTLDALDWAVAKCQNAEYKFRVTVGGDYNGNTTVHTRRYSTDPGQGWPIIEREFIGTRPVEGHTPKGYEMWWRAGYDSYTLERPIHEGPTALIAAMRCYVAGKLGDEVDIPDDLL